MRKALAQVTENEKSIRINNIKFKKVLVLVSENEKGISISTIK